jgi:peptidoglycan/xylan/chitin deacetylase (PgdA/CDA1 family)
MEGSKSDLESELGISVRHLSYPSGSYNATILEQAREIGFETAVTTREGPYERSDQLLALRRVRVNGGAALADLIAGLEGRRGGLPPRKVMRSNLPGRSHSYQ